MILLIPALLTLLAAAPAAPPPSFDAARPAGPRVFLSPMGEPFRTPDPAGDPVGAWFSAADADRDGAVSALEMQADAARFYASLNTNGDHELDPAEIARYENEVAPEVQLALQMRSAGGGRFGVTGERRRGKRRQAENEYDVGLEGAGRFSFLNIPEPVMSADTDLNRGVSRAEFLKAAADRFAMLDADHDGRLTRAELPALPERSGKHKKSDPRRRSEGTPLPD